ncbi:extracellular solute-binding protein, partial [Blautia sp.]
MKKRMRYICCLMLAASLTAGLLAGCGNDTAGTKDKSTTEDKAQTKEKEQDSQEKTGEGEQEDAVKLNPDKPLSITIWHYYNGAQQVAFDELVNEFNETVGKEKGIFVKGYSQGNVNELEDAVMASMNEEVGSEEMPNIFSAYADAAYTVDKRGKLADISAYMSEEELDSYVDSYIEEGRIGKGNTLRIFPTAKSSEIFMMNKTDWDKFAEASGASLDDLSTLEGVTETAQKYYEWTDSLTPDVPEDGKAFYGRDSVANLFV